MPDEVIPDPTPNPTAAPETNDGISEQELEGIITRVVDARLGEALKPLSEKLDGIDLAALRGGIISDISEKVKGSNISEDSLTGKIAGMLDDRFKGLANASTKRKPGWLSRSLGLG